MTNVRTPILSRQRSTYRRMMLCPSLLLLLLLLPITDAFTSSHQWRSVAFQQHHHHDRIPQQSYYLGNRNNNLSMHMGHSHSHSHNHHHIPSSPSTPQQQQQSHRRRLQLSCVASFVALFIAIPLVQRWQVATLIGASSGVGAYTTVQPVWLRIRTWMKGITRHRPRYAPRTNAADRVTVLGYVHTE